MSKNSFVWPSQIFNPWLKILKLNSSLNFTHQCILENNNNDILRKTTWIGYFLETINNYRLLKKYQKGRWIFLNFRRFKRKLRLPNTTKLRCTYEHYISIFLRISSQYTVNIVPVTIHRRHKRIKCIYPI